MIMGCPGGDRPRRKGEQEEPDENLGRERVGLTPDLVREGRLDELKAAEALRCVRGGG